MTTVLSVKVRDLRDSCMANQPAAICEVKRNLQENPHLPTPGLPASRPVRRRPSLLLGGREPEVLLSKTHIAGYFQLESAAMPFM